MLKGGKLYRNRKVSMLETGLKRRVICITQLDLDVAELTNHKTLQYARQTS